MDLLILLFLCMAAALPAATSLNPSTWKPYSHTPHAIYAEYSHQRHSDSARMVEEGESILSSMDAHDKRDLDALLSFRKAITSDPFGRLSNWTAENSDNICSWHGIRCRLHSTRVVAIDLHVSEREGRLKGKLSRSLGNLSLLCNFNLSGNSLAGRIPPEFGQLKSLQVLDLSSNKSLQVLDLSSNVLDGYIPVELGLLQKLRTLDLSENSLTGRIPPGFGQLKALRVLDLSDNNINGSIPVELGLLQKLRTLDLSGNSLTGRIPVELGLLQKLEQLFLLGNKFSGSIPCQLGNLTQLTNLWLSLPNILGSIPSEIFRLPLSSLFLLESINLEGSIPREESIPLQLVNLTQLTELFIIAPNISGSIPSEIFRLPLSSLHLESFSPSLYLESFSLEGSIPKDIVWTMSIPKDIAIANLSRLIHLTLVGIGVQGENIAIANLTKLSTLSLLGNGLTSSIFKVVLNLRQLTSLDLSNNRLKGRIPKALGKLSQLNYLSLDNYAERRIPIDNGQI